MYATQPGQNYFTSTTSDNKDNGTDENGQSLAAQHMMRTSERVSILKRLDLALMHSHDDLYPKLEAVLAKVSG